MNMKLSQARKIVASLYKTHPLYRCRYAEGSRTVGDMLEDILRYRASGDRTESDYWRRELADMFPQFDAGPNMIELERIADEWSETPRRENLIERIEGKTGIQADWSSFSVAHLNALLVAMGAE